MDEWTVGKIEEAMWSIRAAGGTDDTLVDVGHNTLQARNLEFDSRWKGLPPVQVEATLPHWLVLTCQTAGVLVALPLVVAAIIWSWGVLAGVLF